MLDATSTSSEITQKKLAARRRYRYARHVVTLRKMDAFENGLLKCIDVLIDRLKNAAKKAAKSDQFQLPPFTEYIRETWGYVPRFCKYVYAALKRFYLSLPPRLPK